MTVAVFSVLNTQRQWTCHCLVTSDIAATFLGNRFQCGIRLANTKCIVLATVNMNDAQDRDSSQLVHSDINLLVGIS